MSDFDYKNHIEINDKIISTNDIIISTNDIIIKYENNFNNKQDSFCLICLEKNGIKILCINCKYKYCIECANKINNVCAICVRIKTTKTTIRNDNIDINDYTLYENIDDYNSVEDQYFLTFRISLIAYIIYMFWWIIAILFFKYCIFRVLGILFS